MPEYDSGTHIDLRAIGQQSTNNLDADDPANTVILTYPNNTLVTLRGDIEIIRQLVAALDQVSVVYHEPKQE